MGIGGMLFLAVGVAIDAAVVSAARGLAAPRAGMREALRLALFFGGAQAAMPTLGWWIGSWVGPALAAWDHWLACGVLCIVGLHMIWEARKPPETVEPELDTARLFGLRILAGLAFATSVDAWAVGLTLPVLGAPLVTTAVLMGVITALLSVLGLFAGRRFGLMFGQPLDTVGGLILIGLGLKTLLADLLA